MCQSWWSNFVPCQFRSVLWILSLIGLTVWLSLTIAFTFDNKHHLYPLLKYQPNHVTAPKRHLCHLSFGSFLLACLKPFSTSLPTSLTYSLGPIWCTIASRKLFLDFGLIHATVFSCALYILPNKVRDFMFMPIRLWSPRERGPCLLLLQYHAQPTLSTSV